MAHARLRLSLHSRARSTWLLAIIGALALAVRLAVAVRLAHVHGYTGGDQSDYRLLAFNIIGGNGYQTGGGPTAWRSPGYPVFLSFVIRAGHALPVDLTTRGIVGVAQAFVGTATVVLTGLLGRRVWNATVGVIAAAVLALWPSLVLSTSILLTETLFCALVMLALTLLFWSDPPTRRRATGAGIFLGMAVLTRPVAAPVAAIVVLWLIGRGGVGARAWPLVRAFALAVVVIVLPWTFRNFLHFGTLVPFDTHGGYALCQSNRDGAGPSDPDDPYCAPRGSEVESDRRLTRRALVWMATHPASEASLVARRAAVLARSDGDIVTELVDRDGPDTEFSSNAAYRLTRLADGYWVVMGLLSLVGVALLAIRARSRWLVLAFVGLVVFPLLSTVQSRLHQPIIPLLALGVGGTLSVLGDVGRRRFGHDG